MFRKIVVSAVFVLLALLQAQRAEAACSSYPNSLTNGMPADANQVMVNFNCALLTGGSGASLSGLTLSGTSELGESKQAVSLGRVAH
jgi:hypothetical protein